MTRHHRTIAVTALLVGAALGTTASSAGAAATDGTIARIAGTTPGFAGDGGPATQALVNTPRDLAYLTDGSIVLADFGNDRVRRIAPNGTITTVAGSGSPGVGGLSGDGGKATLAELDRPRGVTALGDGGYLIADTFNNRIRRVSPTGTITTVAGTTAGLSGDGGAATAAKLDQPSDTALLPDGSYLIADTGNNRIRRVGLDGVITTVAGTTMGFGGDGGPATAAQLNQPRDVAVATDGAVLIADTGNNRIRRAAPDGTISTVAGGDTAGGFSGDGDPARQADVRGPFSVAALPHGGFLMADTGNNRVRRVTPLGAIFTVAGSAAGGGGDGGLAKAAQLSAPGAVTTTPSGGFLVADTSNARVRKVSDVGAVPQAVVGRSVDVAPAASGVNVLAAGSGGFLPLQEEDLVPTGSIVDATTGRIAVGLAADSAGTQQTATLDDGAFTVNQSTGDTPFTNFRLPKLAGCSTTTRAAGLRGLQRKKKKGPTRRLWVSEKGGRWRTSTGSVTATAVGTVWHTTLRCDGTLVTVREGIVSVRDIAHRKQVTVRAGQSYLVRTKGRLNGA